MTGTNVTTRERAQFGLEQLQEAIYQHLEEHGPKQPYEVANALGLWRRTSRDPRSATIPHTVMDVMVNLGLLVKGLGIRPKYSVRAR